MSNITNGAETDTVEVEVRMRLRLAGVPRETDVRPATAKMLEQAWQSHFESLTPTRIESEEMSRVPDGTGT